MEHHEGKAQGEDHDHQIKSSNGADEDLQRLHAGRRRFLTTGAALAAGSVAHSVVQVAKAQRGMAISPGLPELWMDTLTETSAAALAGRSLAMTMLADVPGMDQTHRDALDDLVVQTGDMSSAAIDARVYFESRPPDEQDQLAIDLGPIIDAANDGLEAINEGIKEIDDQLPGIPAGGIVDGIGDATEGLADSLEGAADSMDSKLPGSGTVVRVVETGVRLATVLIRILGTLCD